MRTLLLGALVFALAVPLAWAQDPDGCAPYHGTILVDQTAARVGAVHIEAGNQVLDISWDPVPGAPGYLVTVYSEGQHVDYLTARAQCSVSATNGRPYAVQVAAFASDGSVGPGSDPVAATPAFAGDFAFLAAGLAVVWIAVWGYALILARKQQRLMARYEALLNVRPSRDAP